MLKINIDEMRKLLKDAEGVHSDLTGGLQNLASCLEDINGNVKSSDLVAANQGFHESLISKANIIAKQIPDVESFLNAQINEYERVNQTAKETVDSLAQKINETFSKSNL